MREQAFFHLRRDDYKKDWTIESLKEITEQATEEITKMAEQRGATEIEDVKMVIVNQRVITFIATMKGE